MYKKKSIVGVIILSLLLSTGMVGCGENAEVLNNPTNKNIVNVESLSEENLDEASSNEDVSEEVEEEYIPVGINESAMETYGSLQAFTTTTLSGDRYTYENLNDAEMTLVNFWATYDEYCIDNLRELQALSEELPENVKIISVCYDSYDNEAMVQSIVDAAGVDFPVLLDSYTLDIAMIDQIVYISFTGCFDSKGNIVGEILDYMPVSPKDDYKFMMNEALFAMGKEDLDGNVNGEYRTEWAKNVVVENYLMEDDEKQGIYAYLEDFLWGYEIPDDIFYEVEDDYQALADMYFEDVISYSEFSKRVDKDVNSKIREAGVIVPYTSIEGVLEDVGDVETEDYLYLTERADVVTGQAYYDMISGQYEAIEEGMQEVLQKYDLDLDEVTSQILSSNYQFALYAVDESDVEYIDDLRGNDYSISGEDIDMYADAVVEMRELIPDEIWEQIDEVEFITDGFENVMAYVQPADFDFLSGQFRLTIDVLNVMDEEGNLTEEGISTVVHETGHIITLCDDQVYLPCWEGWGDETVEEMYQEDSYIMEFYNEFWLPIADEYVGADGLSDDEGMEASYEYYDAHQNDFVTEYAATNEEEDMAESFMTFVLEDKPTGDTLADQKVLFYYEYPEFVEYRDQYRMEIYN